MSSPARTPWHARVILTLVLVFVAGAVSGAIAMRYRLVERLNKTVAASTKEARSDAVIQNFKTKLELSADQTQKIALVLDDYRHYYESLEDQLDDLRATGKSRILEILNPEQREKFEKMMAELAPQLQPGKK